MKTLEIFAFVCFIWVFFYSQEIWADKDCKLHFRKLCNCYNPPNWNLQYLKDCNVFLPAKSRALCFFNKNGTNYFTNDSDKCNSTGKKQSKGRGFNPLRKYDVYSKIFTVYENYSECIMRSPGMGLGSDYDINAKRVESAISMLIDGISFTENAWKKAYNASIDTCIQFVKDFRNKTDTFSPAVAFLYCEFMKALAVADPAIHASNLDCAKTYLYYQDCADSLLDISLAMANETQYNQTKN